MMAVIFGCDAGQEAHRRFAASTPCGRASFISLLSQSRVLKINHTRKPSHPSVVNIGTMYTQWSRKVGVNSKN